MNGPKKRPLPPDWRWARLGEVLEQVQRPEPLKSDREYRLLGVKWYAEGLFERERKLGRTIAAKELHRVEAGDLIYNRLFAWKGAFAMVDHTYAGGYVSGEFPIFRASRDDVEEYYVFYCFARPGVWKWIEQQSAGTAKVSRNRWREDQFLSCRLPLPPFPEQRRITARLSEQMAQVEKMRQAAEAQLQAVNALPGALLEEVFGGVEPPS